MKSCLQYCLRLVAISEDGRESPGKKLHIFGLSLCGRGDALRILCFAVLRVVAVLGGAAVLPDGGIRRLCLVGR